MKKLITYLIIIIMLIASISYAVTINNNKQKASNKIENTEEKFIKQMKKLDYYKNKNKSRYISYYNNNKNLSATDIVTRINIGLDNAYYSKTKITPYHNKDYILVNKYIQMKDNYIPENLENLDTSYSRSGMKLVKSAKIALEKMIDKAKKDGYTIRVISSYRSYNYQVNLYNKYKEEDGEEKADTYSARPGFSEHQTGLCIDVDDNKLNYTDFDKSSSFNWMQENAHNYGYILRYPEDKTDITGYTYESWHYRYVGQKIATYIKKHNITFDEYYVRFIEDKEK